MTDETITLEFIGRRLDAIQTEMAEMREMIGILTGIVIRLEGAVNGLTQEVASMRSMLLRHGQQLRTLETR